MPTSGARWLQPFLRLTAGCIDTDLPAVRRTLGRSDRFHIESAHAHHAIRVMSSETRCRAWPTRHPRNWALDGTSTFPPLAGTTTQILFHQAIYPSAWRDCRSEE